MLTKNVFANYGFFIYLGLLLSCNRNFCDKDNFYSTYRTRFSTENFNNNSVKSDLEIKQKVFSILCIPKNSSKVLIVESAGASQSYYSRGLLFTYDDSKTYFFNLKDGEVVAGKGINSCIDLNKILLDLQKNFSSVKAKMDKNYENIFDAPIVNVLLYDSLIPQKFDRFSFPIVAWNALYSQ